MAKKRNGIIKKIYDRIAVQRKKEVSTINDVTGGVSCDADRSWHVTLMFRGRRYDGGATMIFFLITAAVEVAQVVRESWSSLVTSAAHCKTHHQTIPVTQKYA